MGHRSHDLFFLPPRGGKAFISLRPPEMGGLVRRKSPFEGVIAHLSV